MKKGTYANGSSTDVEPLATKKGNIHSNGVHSAGSRVSGAETSHAAVNAATFLNDIGPRPAELKSGKEWNIRHNPSLFTFTNPIRTFTESIMLVKSASTKEFISLAQGDPALFGAHMKVPEVASSSLLKVIQEGKNNGYTLMSGLPACRSAVAEHLSKDMPHNITAKDVVMTVGTANALSITIQAFAFPGCNILLPRPGFPLYGALCKYHSAEIRYYDLLDDRDSEIDLDQIKELADESTAVMVVCNPGNPSGAVFSYKHLYQIATVAAELKVPIISDEVYGALTFGTNPFVSMSQFCSTVPVLALGGISKSWLATGWRLGWIAIWDPNGILKEGKIIQGILNIMQVASGPATPVQAAVPEMLASTPATFFEETKGHLKAGAELCHTRANKIQCLDAPTRPAGSMFMMVRIHFSDLKDIETDFQFSAELFKEESVLVVPGGPFGRPGWLRLVFALSLEQLGEAWDRIELFCSRHLRQP